MMTTIIIIIVHKLPMQFLLHSSICNKFIKSSPNPTFVAPTLQAQKEITLSFKLVVSDGIGTSNEDFVNVITKPDINNAPVSNAGGDSP